MNGRYGMDVLHKVRQTYKEWCKPLCRELGMPQMAFDILMFLSENPGLCTARDINRHQGFKENILSVNVNKLVSEGYLERCPVEEDRRKVRLALVGILIIATTLLGAPIQFGIVPWCSSAVFYMTTLDVPVWGAGGYAPYTVLPFVCPIVAFLPALTGIGIFKPSPEDLAEELQEIEEEENEAFID